jgi:transcriptional regulator with XRE-family HTH domain
VANETAKRLLARVRELREARGLSQEAFAERAGLKYKHYQALEAGRKMNFQILTLVKLAKACGMEPWELLHPEAVTLKLAEEAQAPYSDGTKRRTRRR